MHICTYSSPHILYSHTYTYNWKCNPSFRHLPSISILVYTEPRLYRPCPCGSVILFMVLQMAYRTCKCWRNFGRVPAVLFGFLVWHPPSGADKLPISPSRHHHHPQLQLQPQPIPGSLHGGYIDRSTHPPNHPAIHLAILPSIWLSIRPTIPKNHSQLTDSSFKNRRLFAILLCQILLVWIVFINYLIHISEKYGILF